MCKLRTDFLAYFQFISRCLVVLRQKSVIKPEKNLKGAFEGFCTTFHAQHQFSSNNFNTQSRENVMRNNEMITKGQMLLIFSRILLTNSLRKCMVISLENVYVDIGTRSVTFFLDK